MAKKPYIILIRDGWGSNPKTEENPIYTVNPPFTNKLMKDYPNTLLDAAGEAVGLPDGYQGNSEVGHMTIGSGRIIFQSLPRINKAIKEGEFFNNEAFLGAIDNCKKNNSTMHIIGLLQSEGVHSHEEHLYALLELCKKNGLKDVLVHVITDGRDSPPKDSPKHIALLQKKMKGLDTGKIATISGRFYTMDRDNRWDRTKKAYDCIMSAQSEDDFDDALKKVEGCHAKDETDEFIVPRKLKSYTGIKTDDSIIFYNFRTDRTRQLTRAIIEDKFEGWERKPLDVFYVCMTDYYKPMDKRGHIAFEEILMTNLLGEVLSKAGLTQLRISETEKYAHVTFFFNGQIEQPFKGEDRMLVPSPKVATYDLKPEMSAYEVTDMLLKELDKDRYDVITINIVNGDMVGHTGVWEACLKAVKTVDECVEKIVKKTLEKDGVLLIFADHGNIEDKSAEWRTSHTKNPVPFILVSNDEKLKKAKLKKGKGLKDIAPTLLKLLDIPQPKEMTGESIIE